MSEIDRQARFQSTVLPFLDDAMNLAGWLCGNRTDAEDIVQEACLRAFRYFDGFDGGNAKPWLLAIVRNTCFSWLERNRSQQLIFVADARLEAAAETAGAGTAAPSPETEMQRREQASALNQAVRELPLEFREVIILREIQGLSYKEIAAIVGAPIGTVMSRLARARKRLSDALPEHAP